jgi:Protein of unknown function (DUF1579)
MKLPMIGCACIALAVVAGVATAQEEKAEKKPAGKQPDPQAMMAAYEKAAEPTEQHKMLQKHVGKWNLVLKSWMAPGQPPQESKGTAEGTSLLGGRYVESRVTSEFMGKPFSGVGITGYDKTKKKFVGTWIDSMSTGMMRSEGTADATGKVMTTQAVSTDPLTGKDARMRIVSKWESDDKLVEEFYEKRGGKEMKMMEITYTRAK